VCLQIIIFWSVRLKGEKKKKNWKQRAIEYCISINYIVSSLRSVCVLINKKSLNPGT